MKEKFLHKLEFHKILNILASYTNTCLGKQMALSLIPFQEKEKMHIALSETREATILLQRKGSVPLKDISDITESLKSLKVSSILSLKQLLELGNILSVSRKLKDYFALDIGTLDVFEAMEIYFSSLYSNSSIENTIFSCIIDENTIDDKASSELYKIRKEQVKTSQQIKEKLDFYLHSSKYTKYIQESITTIRNERFVIPVRAEYKQEIKGFIHDISSTGSTVFIEPLSVFELNNHLNELKIAEGIEIEKILQKLSSLFYSLIGELENTFHTIGKIDFIFAKAKYALNTHATEPILSKSPIIKLNQARHPLIASENVVPIDVSLGESFSTLVITGPNTGGKTVTLKTVGLLTCMAMSGLFIPARENSSIYPFEHIFVDIGDEQSIADSLSTFSSHMTTIIDIVNCATPNSLVLLDELGSGTDPVEGANLAISILEYLYSKKSLTIATTHYPEIKNYALVTDGFENASSEFSLDTLTPTYKLLLGVPGKSMAFAISEKLGLKKEILDNAKSKMNTSQINIEELLKSIYDSKSIIEKEKNSIQEKSRQITILENSYNKKLSQLEQNKSELMEKAKLEARNILLEAKMEANLVLKEISHASSKEINQKRKELNEKIQSLALVIHPDMSDSHFLKKEDLSVNMHVFASTLGQNAILLSLPNKSGDVQIQIGSVKTKVPASSLQKLNVYKTDVSVSSNKSKSNSFTIKPVSSEINVIGKNVEEASFIIDKYLDNCMLARISPIRIVHGKGTGALRNRNPCIFKKAPTCKIFPYCFYWRRRYGGNYC